MYIREKELSQFLFKYTKQIRTIKDQSLLAYQLIIISKEISKRQKKKGKRIHVRVLACIVECRLFSSGKCHGFLVDRIDFMQRAHFELTDLLRLNSPTACICITIIWCFLCVFVEIWHIGILNSIHKYTYTKSGWLADGISWTFDEQKKNTDYSII